MIVRLAFLSFTWISSQLFLWWLAMPNFVLPDRTRHVQMGVHFWAARGFKPGGFTEPCSCACRCHHCCCGRILPPPMPRTPCGLGNSPFTQSRPPPGWGPPHDPMMWWSARVAFRLIPVWQTTTGINNFPMTVNDISRSVALWLSLMQTDHGENVLNPRLHIVNFGLLFIFEKYTNA